jgi:hypothetical protein
VITALLLIAALDTTPILGPYHGQWWECVCSRDFYVRVDTIQVKHVWRDRLVPMEQGPDIKCDRMRQIKTIQED